MVISVSIFYFRFVQILNPDWQKSDKPGDRSKYLLKLMDLGFRV